MKQPFLPSGEPNLCNDYILKDPEYIDLFCINIPYHCIPKQVPLDTDLLDNLVLWKEVVRPTKKPRIVGLHKSNPKKTTNKKKTGQKNKKYRSANTQIPDKYRSAKTQTQ